MKNPTLKNLSVSVLLMTCLLSGCATAPQAVAQESTTQVRPKYGPAATRLVHSNTYIKTNNAPDFWPLISYYVPQQDSRSCSVAVAAMLINAARANQNLSASDELVTQKGILERVNHSIWNKGVGEGGHGVSLDEFSKILEESLAAYGFTKASVQTVHVNDQSTEMKARLNKTLLENEKSSNDFIIANFLQSEFTGDPEGAVGHYAVIGAYDSKNKKVLILDPDRQYYEPYWVSEQTLLQGMNTKDSSGKSMRGYIWVKLAQ